MSKLMTRRRAPLLLAAVLVLAGCASSGSYFWARDVPAASFTVHRTGDYVIETDDLLYVRVLGQDSVSTRARVGPDGKLTMPLLGEIEARGRRPTTLAKELETRLEPFIVVPSVTVTVEEQHKTPISVVGEVAHAGVYVVSNDAGVLEAISAAGGLTEYASRSRIFVVRGGGASTLRVRFTYERLSRGEPPDAQFSLRPGDAVVVE